MRATGATGAMGAVGESGATGAMGAVGESGAMVAMVEWWIERIERLKRESGLSDVALAKRLDISPAMLAHVRVGRRVLPLQARIRLLDGLGYVVTRNLLLRLVPDEVRAALIAANAALAEAHYAPNEPDPNADLELPPEWH